MFLYFVFNFYFIYKSHPWLFDYLLRQQSLVKVYVCRLALEFFGTSCSFKHFMLENSLSVSQSVILWIYEILWNFKWKIKLSFKNNVDEYWWAKLLILSAGDFIAKNCINWGHYFGCLWGGFLRCFFEKFFGAKPNIIV